MHDALFYQRKTFFIIVLTNCMIGCNFSDGVKPNVLVNEILNLLFAFVVKEILEQRVRCAFCGIFFDEIVPLAFLF